MQGVSDVAAEELGQELERFGDLFLAKVDRAAMDIERKSGTKTTRRKVALWRISMTTQYRSAAEDLDVRAAALDIWSLCQRMLDLLESGGEPPSLVRTSKSPWPLRACSWVLTRV